MSEPRPADAAPPPEKAASQADLQAFAQDRERVQAWLDARATGARAVGASTLSQYRVEAERVCWYARTFGKPIARWLRDDAVAYLRFLQEPPAWAISARGIERDDANWTPLRGALSVRSTRQSSVIAANLCGWLQRTGYLRTNPFLDDDAIVITVPEPSTTSSGPSVPQAAVESEASLSAADMTLLVDAVRARVALGREARLRQARDRFLAELLAHAGLRVSELVSLKHSQVNVPQGVLRIVGKGSKTRIAPILPAVRDAVEAYLALLPFSLQPADALHHVLSRALQVELLGRHARPSPEMSSAFPHDPAARSVAYRPS